jgi:peptidoglycan hydrolase-like protein with peptidoglycan-binding domain
VLALQERLQALGYYSADVTGIFDNNTISSMKSFEKANGLKIDGKASIDDQKSIFSENAVPKPTPTPKPTKKPTSTPKPTKTPDPRKAYGTFKFKDASRYPEQYIGTQVKITGKVLQVLGNKSDGFQLRVASKGSYDNVVYIIVLNATENILEDDKINFYCSLAGTTSYETILGAEVTLPLLYCDFYEFR